MADGYFVVNEDYQLGCADSLMMDVNLGGLSPACFVPVKSNKLKVGGKNTLLMLNIAATAATGVIKTSLIDGVSVTFVSATGTIKGTAKKNTSMKQKLCLADSEISAPTVAAYTGNGSVGDLIVVGVNVASGVTVTDKCKVWFKDAGQTLCKAV